MPSENGLLPSHNILKKNVMWRYRSIYSFGYLPVGTLWLLYG